MSCESPKEQLFAHLERSLARTVEYILERHSRGDELLLGKPITPLPVPTGTVDYHAAQSMCLECARAIIGEVFALADGIAATDDEGVFVKIVNDNGEDLGGDLLNEHQQYYFNLVEP